VLSPEPLPPGSAIGILGGGQLGRMLALAAARLGFRCHVLAPDRESPAFDVAAARSVAEYSDPAALAVFAAAVDVVTYEFENVPLEAAEWLAARVPVRPGPRALAVSQDRLTEKTFLRGLGLQSARFAPVDDLASLDAALAALGSPAILKTRRFGYDGKGQAPIAAAADAGQALTALAGAPAVLEERVAFAQEISIISARSVAGAIVHYDVAANEHRAGILFRSRVPAALAPAMEAEARRAAEAILGALDYVGVIGIEFFVAGGRGEGTLLVNEFAPRVHNSGHWTEDACSVSQFENHVRAIAGWPLGRPVRHFDVEMTNLIGAEIDDWERLAGEPGARLHVYGKREVRPGRKMGHVNRLRPRS
jgi:5-(carboxyamino)imidazole ribonucleotide synthase